MARYAVIGDGIGVSRARIADAVLCGIVDDDDRIAVGVVSGSVERRGDRQPGGQQNEGLRRDETPP